MSDSPNLIDEIEAKLAAKRQELDAKVAEGKINKREADHEMNKFDNKLLADMNARDAVAARQQDPEPKTQDADQAQSADDARKQKAIELAEAAKAQKEREQAKEQGRGEIER